MADDAQQLVARMERSVMREQPCLRDV